MDDKNIFYDEQFSWNHHLFLPIKRCKLSQDWSVNVIQGFVNGTKSKFGEIEFEYFLITRRSHKRGGTRYNHRGGD